MSDLKFLDDSRFPDLKSWYSSDYARFIDGRTFDKKTKDPFTAMDAVVTKLVNWNWFLKWLLDPDIKHFSCMMKDKQDETVSPLRIKREGDIVTIRYSSTIQNYAQPTRKWDDIVKYRGCRDFGSTVLIKWALVDTQVVDSEHPDVEGEEAERKTSIRKEVERDLAKSLMISKLWITKTSKIEAQAD